MATGGRAPGINAHEDKLLLEHVKILGEGRWNSVSNLTGLRRSGKSCRVNYLRPELTRGKTTPEEEKIILEQHALWGNKWSTIARSLPGRTDNEIKNYWRTHFKKSKPSMKLERTMVAFVMQQKEQDKPKEEGGDEQQQPQLRQQQQHQEEEEEEKASMSMMIKMHVDEITRLMQYTEDDMETSFMYPLNYYWLHGGSCDSSISDGTTDQEDESSWGSLWNLDGVDGGVRK